MRDFDAETVVDPNTNAVDHKASLAANVRALGADLYRALPGTTAHAYAQIPEIRDEFTLAGAVALGFTQDLAIDLGAGVFSAVKDIGDIAVHGVMLGIKTLFGSR